MKRLTRPVWSWALYDWANSAFATVVITAIFPIFFKSYWSAGTDISSSTAKLGFAHSLASFLIAGFAPMLGAIADRGSQRKGLLFLFTLIGVISTFSLPWVAMGHWPLAIGLFVIANIGFAASNTFYDALICSVSKPRTMEFVSAFGFSLGYLGGGLLFLINIIAISKPEWFGYADKVEATRFSFLWVAVWWTLFSIPLFLFVPESNPESSAEPKQNQKLPVSKLVRAGFDQLLETLKHLRGNRNLILFLLAYFFYIDGVNTIIKMSVDYGMSIGLKSESLISAILLVQFVGFPATLLLGWIAGRIGPIRTLFICIAVYAAGTVWAYFMKSEIEFFVLAFLIGMVQGGIQSVSRAVYARLIPSDQAGEFFGFYNMLGKFSAILGPGLIAVVSLLSQDPRISILSVILLFVIGAMILSKVKLNDVKNLA